MKFLTSLYLLAICLIIFPLLAPAVEIHVPGEYPTIQEAVNAAQDGDSILVAPGEYEGAYAFDTPNNICLIGSGAFTEEPTIITSRTGCDSSVCFFLQNLSGWTVSDVEIRETFSGGAWGGACVTGSDNIKFERIHISQIIGSGAEAINMWNNSNITLSYSLFTAGNYDVIRVESGSNYYLRNLTVSGDANGIIVRNIITGDLVIENCISAFNDGDGIEFPGTWQPYYVVQYNDSYGNGGGGSYTGFIPDPTNISLNPQFVGGTGWEAYQLSADSPCIDAGNPTSPPDPDGTRADMGCFYYHQGTVIPGGYISGIWDYTGSPYIIEGDIAVQGGDTLFIKPGVEVRFNQGVGLTVESNGYLSCDGTAQPGVGDTIFFTSDLPYPQPGDWEGIFVDENATCELIFCTVEYGGSIALDSHSPPSSLTDCRFSLPVASSEGSFNMVRCLITVDCFFSDGDTYNFEECYFIGNLDFEYCFDIFITSSITEQNIQVSDYGSLQISNGEIWGGVGISTCDGYLDVISSIIHGSIIGTNSNITINTSTVFDSIDVRDTMMEYVFLDIINSVIYGSIFVDWIELNIAGSIINNDILLNYMRRVEIFDSEINGFISGTMCSVAAYGLAVVITGNVFTNGGIDILSVSGDSWSLQISENLIINCPGDAIRHSTAFIPATIRNNTVCGSGGSGISVSSTGNTTLSVLNNIVSNTDEYGVYISGFDSAYIAYNDVWNCTLGDYFGIVPGPGSISADPLFVFGPDGEYYLSQIAAGQTLQSPCVSAGDPSSPLIDGTTRTDGVPDMGIVDLGYHYPAFAPPQVLTIDLAPYSPPVIIPEVGGSFAYDITVENINEPSPFDVWVNIELPSGLQFTTLNANAVFIPIGSSVTRQRAQAVPGNAPAGDYICWGAVGTYPWTVVDSDSFAFIKEGSESIWMGVEGWFSSGEPFPGEGVSSVEAPPTQFALCGVFPNPFNPATTIRLALPEAARIRLTVYDIGGRMVQELMNCWREGGMHEVTFDGSNLASGIYLTRLQAGDFTQTQKVILLK